MKKQKLQMIIFIHDNYIKWRCKCRQAFEICILECVHWKYVTYIKFCICYLLLIYNIHKIHNHFILRNVVILQEIQYKQHIAHALNIIMILICELIKYLMFLTKKFYFPRAFSVIYIYPIRYVKKY